MQTSNVLFDVIQLARLDVPPPSNILEDLSLRFDSNTDGLLPRILDRFGVAGACSLVVVCADLPESDAHDVDCLDVKRPASRPPLSFEGDGDGVVASRSRMGDSVRLVGMTGVWVLRMTQHSMHLRRRVLAAVAVIHLSDFDWSRIMAMPRTCSDHYQVASKSFETASILPVRILTLYDIIGGCEE